MKIIYMLKNLKQINLTNRHKIFIVGGIVFGFITGGLFGAFIGLILGICISEITHMIDRFGKKW